MTLGLDQVVYKNICQSGFVTIRVGKRIIDMDDQHSPWHTGSFGFCKWETDKSIFQNVGDEIS